MTELSRALHASFLALLVLGLMIAPVLTQLGELHAAEHAEFAADPHDHDHGADHEDDPDRDDHNAGAHGLLHFTCGAGSLTNLVATISIQMAYGRMPMLQHPDASGVPHQLLSPPFRPPIA
ncbi:MAG: hypothetical protein ABL934_02310 [Lysobacteraceae bacterium]